MSDTKAGDPSGPVLIDACCGQDDSVVMRIQARYDSSFDAFRPPEIAAFPYRFSSELKTPGRIVVMDSIAWSSLWPRIVGASGPKALLPPVNFANEMLIVATMGTRSSGGYVISVDSAVAGSDSLRVQITERGPGPTCGTIGMMTAPIAVARLRRTDRPIAYRERKIVTDCGR